MSSYWSWAGVAATACAASALLAQAAPADEKTFRREASQVLEIGWTSPAKSLPLARERYDAAKATAPGDPRAAYSLSLVYLKWSRYREANELLDETLKLAPNDLAAREARAWSAFALRQHGDGLHHLEVLAQQLADRAAEAVKAEGPPPAEAEGTKAKLPAELRLSAQSLGRLIGYAAGPGKADVARTLVVIEETLPPDLLAELESGRLDSADLFAQLTGEGEKVAAATKDAQTEAMVHEQERITVERGEIAERKKVIETEEAKAKEEARTRLASVDDQIAQVSQQMSGLQLQAGMARSDLIGLDSQIGLLRDQLEDVKDPTERDLLEGQIARYHRTQSRIASSLTGLNQAIRTLAATQSQLASQRAAIVNQYQLGANSRQTENANLDGKGKRLNRAENRNVGSVNGRSSQSRQAATKATTVSTYYTFPIEVERQRLLNELKP